MIHTKGSSWMEEEQIFDWFYDLYNHLMHFGSEKIMSTKIVHFFNTEVQYLLFYNIQEDLVLFTLIMYFWTKKILKINCLLPKLPEFNPKYMRCFVLTQYTMLNPFCFQWKNLSYNFVSIEQFHPISYMIMVLGDH